MSGQMKDKSEKDRTDKDKSKKDRTERGRDYEISRDRFYSTGDKG